jgi:hypothetical protein
LRSSGSFGFLGFLSFVVYFELLSLEQGFRAHRMAHSCSDSSDEEIELLFQLKDNGGIEIMFQWFKVQCKMGKLHETCKTMRKQMNTKRHESNGRNA